MLSADPIQIELKPRLIELLGSDFDFTALTEVDDAVREDILEELPPETVAEGVRELDSNGIINQPFALANATINVLGKLIIEGFKDQMTAEQRQEVEKAVDDADAKTLLAAGLKLHQAFDK